MYPACKHLGGMQLTTVGNRILVSSRSRSSYDWNCLCTVVNTGSCQNKHSEKNQWVLFNSPSYSWIQYPFCDHLRNVWWLRKGGPEKRNIYRKESLWLQTEHTSAVVFFKPVNLFQLNQFLKSCCISSIQRGGRFNLSFSHTIRSLTWHIWESLLRQGTQNLHRNIPTRAQILLLHGSCVNLYSKQKSAI